MKNLFIIILCILSNSSYAQRFQNIEKLKDRNLIEPRMLQNMEPTKINDLNDLIGKNSAYFNNLIKTTSSETLNLLRDPNVLAETFKAKEELDVNSFSINHLDEYQQFISISAASEAKFPVANFTVSGESKVFAVQYIAYKPIETEEGSRYLGYGLYMVINAGSFDGSGNISLPYLAASATVSNNHFTYGAQLFGFEGIDAHKLLRTAMPGSNFGMDTYVGYEKFKDLLIEGIENGSLAISPVFIDPMFAISELESDNIALTRIYALICVAKRIELGSALSNNNDQSENAQTIIKKVYKKHANITKLNKKPSSKRSDIVKSKLKSIGIDIKE